MERLADHDPVGIAGLGIIGSRVAARLRAAGCPLWLWSRTVRPEPNFLSSPAELAEASRIIQIFVSDGPALRGVLEAMAPALTPAHIVLNHATVSPAEARESAAIARECHAGFLDVPFTGSRDAAAAGQLVYYAGGPSHLLEAVRPVLSASAQEILPMGEIGEASAVKIATNMISAAAVSSLAEALALLHRQGVPLHFLHAALGKNAARSGVIDMKLPLMLADEFEPRFSLKNMFKDSRLALALAAETGLDLPAAAAFAGTALAALQRGLGDADFSVIARCHGFTDARNALPARPSPPPVESPPAPPAPQPARAGFFQNLFKRSV